MNTKTIFNGKLCLALSVFIFLLVADATGKVNESTDHNAIDPPELLTDGISSDTTKNKVVTIDKVFDTEAPIFTVIPRNGIANSLEEVAFDFVMAVDNLTAVAITSSDLIDGSPYSGILTRTWTATDQSGNSSTASASVRYYSSKLHEQKEIPQTDLAQRESKENNTVLDQNFPNPFSKSTTVPFYLPKADFATLKVYDASGRKIFVCSDNFEKGENEFGIKGSDLQDEGILYYELITTNSKYTKKMLFNLNK